MQSWQIVHAGVGCSCFLKRKKNSSYFRFRCFAATANCSLAKQTPSSCFFTPSLHLSVLSSHPSHSREQRLPRHVKTIFLLDWQRNNLLRGARRKNEVHSSWGGQFLGLVVGGGDGGWGEEGLLARRRWWKSRVLWCSGPAPLKDLLDWKECQGCYSSSGCGRGFPRKTLLAAVNTPQPCVTLAEEPAANGTEPRLRSGHHLSPWSQTEVHLWAHPAHLCKSVWARARGLRCVSVGACVLSVAATCLNGVMMKAWTNTRECRPRSKVNRRSLDSAGDPFERGHALCHSPCPPGCAVPACSGEVSNG